MWEIEVGRVEGWLDSLDKSTLEQVVAALELLSEVGPGLGRPLVDTVAGSRHRNLKELRPGSSGRSEMRILFAFDPQRRAICLSPATRLETGAAGTKNRSPWRTICLMPTLSTWKDGDPMTTLDQYLEKRPIDPNRVEEHKRIMLGAVRAQRLRDLREQAGLTQAQLAARMGTGQRQVSKMENGDLENTKVGTIRRYLEAVGGTMAVEYMVGDQRIQIA